MSVAQAIAASLNQNLGISVDVSSSPALDATPSRRLGNLPLANRTFQVEATVPNGLSGAHAFVAYVRASLSDRETSVSVPVNVGVAPTPTHYSVKRLRSGPLNGDWSPRSGGPRRSGSSGC